MKTVIDFFIHIAPNGDKKIKWSNAFALLLAMLALNLVFVLATFLLSSR